MSYTMEMKNDILFIKCSGRLNIENSLELEKDINDRIDNLVKYIVFNFQDVEYISSSGIRVLIATLKRLLRVK